MDELQPGKIRDGTGFVLMKQEILYCPRCAITAPHKATTGKTERKAGRSWREMRCERCGDLKMVVVENR